MKLLKFKNQDKQTPDTSKKNDITIATKEEDVPRKHIKKNGGNDIEIKLKEVDKSEL